ncbi:MAG: hypothetical protein LHV69_00845 [Elusimicrobia bacterium]|nr:hypothetical protein [Candidatus Obscuribacterium magneticum]
MALICLPLIIVVFYASLYPPHLLPELDVINYHYTLPRQHLIQRSFRHLPWSVADLYYLPVQFALAPYWFSTPLPNKFPQFLFLVGLWGLVAQLAWALSDRKWSLQAAAAAFLALFASHGFAIQYGTAMLDIVFTYLFIAAIHSFIRQKPVLAGIELAFFIFSKFPPFYIFLLALFSLTAITMAKIGWTLSWSFTIGRIHLKFGRKWIASLCISSILIAGPFILKSLKYAQTPHFPFAVGRFKVFKQPADNNLPSIKKTAERLFQAVKTGNNDDRGLKGFLTHFFLLSVPTKGVNNSFDYPLGLPYLYLLFLFPVLVFTFQSLWKRHLPIFAGLAFVLWGGWRLSSHQARFLYIPLVLIFLSGALTPTLIQKKGLWVGLFVSLFFTGFSLIRMHRADFGKAPTDVIRPQDLSLLEIGKRRRPDDISLMPIDTPEAAYATFPIDVTAGSGHFVLPRDSVSPDSPK